MNTTDPLPAHLERIGDQLIAAAESLYATSGSRWRAHPQRVLVSLARAPRLALSGGIASLATVLCLVVMFATAATPPAYALTHHANGTYTITINDIASGVPGLNARLKQVGIDAVAVPVTRTCTAAPASLTGRVRTQLAPALTKGGSGGVINLDRADIPTGTEGVIAAYESPSGQVDLTFSTTTGRVPSCLNTNDVTPASPASNGRH